MGKGQAGRKPAILEQAAYSVNPHDNEIIAFELTDDDTSDGAMIGDLMAASGGNNRAIIADGAYDGEPTCDVNSH